jgi:hypothetical protein
MNSALLIKALDILSRERIRRMGSAGGADIKGDFGVL